MAQQLEQNAATLQHNTINSRATTTTTTTTTTCTATTTSSSSKTPDFQVVKLADALYGPILKVQVDGAWIVLKQVDLELAQATLQLQGQVADNPFQENRAIQLILNAGGHPNLVRYHHTQIENHGKTMVIPMEYCPEGDLWNFLSKWTLDAKHVDASPSPSPTSSPQPPHGHYHHHHHHYDHHYDHHNGSQPEAADADGVAATDATATTMMTTTTTTTTTATTRSSDVPVNQIVIHEKVALRLTGQIADALEFLHRHDIAHRDLSLENVLINEQGKCKLMDFGLSTSATGRCCGRVGKAYYMAPEVVAGKIYDPRRADVWSLGIILFMLLTGSPLCELAESSVAAIQLVSQCGGLERLLDHWHVRVSYATSDLMSRMLQIDPTKRITPSDILRHPAVAWAQASRTSSRSGGGGGGGQD